MCPCVCRRENQLPLQTQQAVTVLYVSSKNTPQVKSTDPKIQSVQVCCGKPCQCFAKEFKIYSTWSSKGHLLSILDLKPPQHNNGKSHQRLKGSKIHWCNAGQVIQEINHCRCVTSVWLVTEQTLQDHPHAHRRIPGMVKRASCSAEGWGCHPQRSWRVGSVCSEPKDSPCVWNWLAKAVGAAVAAAHGPYGHPWHAGQAAGTSQPAAALV